MTRCERQMHLTISVPPTFINLSPALFINLLLSWPPSERSTLFFVAWKLRRALARRDSQLKRSKPQEPRGSSSQSFFYQARHGWELHGLTSEVAATSLDSFGNPWLQKPWKDCAINTITILLHEASRSLPLRSRTPDICSLDRHPATGQTSSG